MPIESGSTRVRDTYGGEGVKGLDFVQVDQKKDARQKAFLVLSEECIEFVVAKMNNFNFNNAELRLNFKNVNAELLFFNDARLERNPICNEVAKLIELLQLI